jgi:crossover junction endodeoxyribonuclease RusA
MRLVYRLPQPPSGNRQSRTGNGTHYTPKQIKAFRESVFVDVLQQGRPSQGPIDHPVGIIVRLADVRGDLTNRLKTLEDSLTHAGVWTDDKLVWAQQNFYDSTMPKGRCVIVIADLRTHFIEAAKVSLDLAKRAKESA